MKKITIPVLFIFLSLLIFSQNFTLASFNIQHLGTARKNISYVSQILNVFDFTAIQEVQNKKVIQQLERENPSLKFLVSDTSVGNGYKEFYAFSYNPDKIHLTSVGFYPGSGFMRPPFAVIATINSTQILVINTHIQFGKSQLVREQEISKLPQVVSYFANRYKNINTIAVMGDFNIDSNDTINYLLSGSSPKLTPVLHNDILTTIGKTGYVNQYDKIYVTPSLLPMIVNSGSITIKNISLQTYKSEISDHRPIFMILNVGKT